MKYRGLDFPGVRAVALRLRLLNQHWRKEVVVHPTGGPGDLDVRLNVQDDGSWRLWEGDASYDTDHRGYWGCASLNGEPFDSLAMARQLIDDCKEHYAQVKDDV